MKTLLIDNYDSFTYNLFHLIAEANGEEPVVVRNDESSWAEVSSRAWDNIVLSPGPGRPEVPGDFGICREAILQAEVPLLGICLGNQGLAHLYGGRVIAAPEPIHGQTSEIFHASEGLFRGIPQGFAATRYHSLVGAEPLPDCLERIAWTAPNETGKGLLMGMRHLSRPQWGVQFHPESIASEHGVALLRNFRDLTPKRKAMVPVTVPSRVDRPPAQWKVVYRTLDFLPDLERVFAAYSRGARAAFWLDSSRAEKGLSRFSFIGTSEGRHGQIVQYDRASQGLMIFRNHQGPVGMRADLLEWLETELAARRVESELPFEFAGGFAGYLGYELRADCGSDAAHCSPLPDAALVFADRFLAFDHLEGTSYLVAIRPANESGHLEEWFRETAALIADPPPMDAAAAEGAPLELELARDREQYLKDVAQCLEWIRLGESYELCLTNQILAEGNLDAFEVYRCLRRINPAPYAAFLRFPKGKEGSLAVLSSSPERFLRIDSHGTVESKPIKGTRRRGATPEEDAALRQELGTAVKDRAENLMIVDLMRNDIGRVCETGSVHVPKLMDVETYSTVHQLVSTVRGKLRTGTSAIDCIRASFPGGSMTGAPKLRSMKLLDELERAARGPYSGSIGYLSCNGAADLSIAIRTIVANGSQFSIGAGGAVVALSQADSEFEETLWKARAQVAALALAAGCDAAKEEAERILQDLRATGRATVTARTGVIS